MGGWIAYIQQNLQPSGVAAQPVRLTPSTLSLLLQNRRGTPATVVRIWPSTLALLLGRTHIPAVPNDLLSALVQYLRSEPTVSAALPLDARGRVPVYHEQAPSGADRPFVVVSDYGELHDTDTLQDQKFTLFIHILCDGEDAAELIGGAVRNAIDSPNFNVNSIGRNPLAWSGATEVFNMRHDTRLERLGQFGRGGKYVYQDQMEYEFWATPED